MTNKSRLTTCGIAAVISTSCVLVVMLTVPESVLTDFLDILMSEDWYHASRARFDRLDLPLTDSMGSEEVPMADFKDVDRVSRFATPWHFDGFVFNNHLIIQKSNSTSSLIEKSKRHFYKYLERFEFHKPEMTSEMREMLIKTFNVFSNTCVKNRIRYFLCGDTLLGVFRHQGFVPWTGNVHVCMDESDWMKIQVVLSRVPEFHLEVSGTKAWMFYSNEYKVDKSKPFPYVDISFYRTDSSHVWLVQPAAMKHFLYKREEIFPLAQIMFEECFGVVPSNSSAILYDFFPRYQTDCYSSNQRVLSYVSDAAHAHVNLPCKFLHKIYPFVFEQVSPHGRKIVVKVGNTVVKTLQERYFKMYNKISNS